MSLKLGKFYENITDHSSWTLYSLDYQKILGYLEPGDRFVVIDYCSKPDYTWDSYKILFEDGNLYQITFTKTFSHAGDKLYNESFSEVL